MRSALLALLLVAAVGTVSTFAETPPPAPASAEKSAADAAHDALWQIWRAPAPEGLDRKDPAFWEFQDKQMREFVAAARAFAEKFPDDPRRWDGLIQSSFTRPWFLTGFKPAFAEAPRETNLIVDEPALAAFRAEQAKLLAAAIEWPGASERQRGGAFFALLADARGAAAARGVPFDPEVFRPLVERVVAAMPDERALPVVEQFADALRRVSAEKAAAFEASLQANPKIAAGLAAGEAKRKEAAAKEAEAAKARATGVGSIQFTAADGREVDLTKLRGKVVLVDFWATWCGPCIAELPNVKKVYAAYHDRGFEVVGIALENPGLRGKETPEQVAAKLATAKQKLLDFVSKNEMPWPQHFDGQWWKNEFAVKFGVNAIPAMFLLDREGRIATSEARGDKLEAEVKRLLGL